MMYFTILVLVVGFFEIRAMIKRKQSREIVVFVVVAVLSLSLAYFYFSNPYGESLAQRILRILGKEL